MKTWSSPQICWASADSAHLVQAGSGLLSNEAHGFGQTGR
jgi:hypothetical protein